LKRKGAFGIDEGPEPSLKRPRTHLDDFSLLGTSKPRTHNGVQTVKTQGRTDPIMPQAIISMTAAVDRGLYDRALKSNPKNQLFPVGEAADFDVNHGELAIELIGNTGTPLSLGPTSKNKQGFGDYKLQTCVNGLSANQKSRLGGVISGKGAQLSTGENVDNAVAVIISGTTTIINTGRDLIRPGDVVYYSLTPNVVYDEERKRMIPAIEQRGVPPTKMRVTIFPFNQAESTGIINTALRHALKAMNEIDADFSKIKSVSNRAVAAFRQEQGIPTTTISEVNPLDLYIKYSILGFFGKLEDKDKDACRAYMKQLFDEEYDRGRVSTGNMFISLKPELPTTDEERGVYTEEARIRCLADFWVFLETHRVGKAMSVSPSGAQTDMNIGR